MAVPKNRTSKSRRDKRASNKGIKPKSVATCQTCQAPIAPHQVCKDCGYYKGKKILRTKTDRAHERGQVRQAKEARVKKNGEAGAPIEASSEEKKSE